MLQCGMCSKHINELFIFCYVKIQWSLIALNGFCNIMHWSSGKQWFTVLGRSSKYWQYVIKTQYKKSHLLITPLIFNIKICMYWEVVMLMEADTKKFSKILKIFNWKLEFYYSLQIVFVIFLEMTGSRFQENICQMPLSK